MSRKYSVANREEFLSISQHITPIRLDKFLHKLLESQGISRERIKRYIQEGHVYINAIVCTQISKKIHEKDKIDIYIPEERSLLVGEEGTIDVIDEDPSFLVLNKPASLVVHPCTSTPHGTLLQRVLFHYPEIADMGGERPAIVHRLDKDTTGIILLARTEQARYTFIQAFRDRTITKSYLAFVEGHTPEHGIIEHAIRRDPLQKTRMHISHQGKPAYTEYKRIAVFPEGILPYPVSFLHIYIATGRTHQIRVHLSSEGFPLLGDTLYGAHISFAKRPLLHAYTLQFHHPLTGKKLFYKQRPPLDFEQTYITLSTPSTHVILTGCAGSGKSTVLQYYIDAGIPCCSADDIIEELYKEGNSIWHYFKQSYGNQFFEENGMINRAKVLNKMQISHHYKQEIERVTHSFLIEIIHSFWKRHREAPYTIIEVPLYFESTLFQKECPADIIITVSSPQESRIARMRSKGWSEEKIQYILEHQYNDRYKREHADYVIDNSSDYVSLEEKSKESLSYIEQYRTHIYSTIREEYFELLIKKI